jgi:geranylgeranyl diphosphate synthase type I
MGWDSDASQSSLIGKRIRPLLVLLVTEAGEGDFQAALPAAAAVELVHNFSLIHDDIQDQSPMRRGRDAVWKRWGIAQAINAGDAMFSLAHLAILRLNETTNPEIALKASRLLQETCLELTHGQYLDLTYQSSDQFDLDAYWPMIKGKTAALLSTCADLGAMIAGVPETLHMEYVKFAEQLGLAFQIQDDILGIWGDDQRMGKSSKSDLLTGKKSLPVLFALSRKGEFARRWIEGQVSQAEVPSLALLLETEGAREFAQNHADQLTRQALLSLRTAQSQGSAGEALEELALKLLSRSN